MLIAVDFDGTIVEHKYPDIGKEKPFAIDTLRRLASEGNRIVLWTSREGKLLDEAVDFCRKKGLEFYAVNSDTPDGALFDHSNHARKLTADVYIDDRNVGGLMEWGEIYEAITQRRMDYKKSHRHRCRLFRR